MVNNTQIDIENNLTSLNIQNKNVAKINLPKNCYFNKDLKSKNKVICFCNKKFNLIIN